MIFLKSSLYRNRKKKRKGRREAVHSLVREVGPLSPKGGKKARQLGLTVRKKELQSLGEEKNAIYTGGRQTKEGCVRSRPGERRWKSKAREVRVRKRGKGLANRKKNSRGRAFKREKTGKNLNERAPVTSVRPPSLEGKGGGVIESREGVWGEKLSIGEFGKILQTNPFEARQNGEGTVNFCSRRP